MDANAIRAGQAYVELGLNDAPLRAQMDQAEASLASFAEALKMTAAAVGFGALAASMKGFVSQFTAAGAALYESFQKAGKSVAQLNDEAKKLGFTGFDAVARASELSKAFENMSKAVKATGIAIGEALAPAFKPVLEILTGLQEATTKFIQNNQTLVQVLGGVVGIGATLAAGLAGMATAIYAVTTAGRALRTAFLGVSMAASSLYALMLNPISLALAGVAAGVAALGYLFVTQTDIGKRAFESLGDVFSRTWGGMVDAVMAGELELAFNISLAGMRVAWTDFANWFTSTLPNLSAAFRGLFADQVTDMWSAIGHIVNPLGSLLSARNLAALGELTGLVPQGTRREMNAGDRRDARNPYDPRAELAAYIAQANELRARRERERRATYEAGLGETAGGARGTFSSYAVGGLVGPGANPVVRAIEQLTSVQREELAQARIIAGRLAEIAQMQAVFQ